MEYTAKKPCFYKIVDPYGIQEITTLDTVRKSCIYPFIQLHYGNRNVTDSNFTETYGNVFRKVNFSTKLTFCQFFLLRFHSFQLFIK